jgi:hypothetical protein
MVGFGVQVHLHEAVLKQAEFNIFANTAVQTQLSQMAHVAVSLGVLNVALNSQ